MRWNLDQLEAFVTVSELGSFSSAARELGRAQSAVSQAVALLEADLAVTLFSRHGGKTPCLTPEGQALLAEARSVLQQCERLQGRADDLVRGQEAVLKLALDEAMPYPPVLDSLEQLAGRFPTLDVQLSSSAQGDVARKLLERRADLGLLFDHGEMPAPLDRRRLGTIEMMTVCSGRHPLASMARVDRQVLAQHRQLLMIPQEGQYSGGEAISASVWRADSFYAMAELVMRGLGWAWLPRHVVRYPGYDSLLFELSSDWVPPPLVVELVYRRDVQPGPASRALSELLAQHLSALV